MLLKRSLVAVFALSCVVTSAAWAQDVYVNGYTRNDGTYVSGHYRSAPNHTKSDNWTQIGNTNPYTGKAGTQDCGMNCANYGRPSPNFGSYQNNDSLGSSSMAAGGLFGVQQ